MTINREHIIEWILAGLILAALIVKICMRK
jgi:hypothetical protein